MALLDLDSEVLDSLVFLNLNSDDSVMKEEKRKLWNRQFDEYCKLSGINFLQK